MVPDVVLLPSLAHAEYWRKRMSSGDSNAESDAAGFPRALLGVTVAAFDSWIADLWELHGDGRIPVDNAMRRMLVRRALQETAVDPGEHISVGTVSLVAQCVREAAGVRAFERAVEQATSGELVGGLDEAEVRILQAVGRYEHLLEGYGLIEPGEAAAVIAGRASEVFVRPLHVRQEGGAPLNWCQQAFFEACTPYVEWESRADDAGEKGLIGRAPADVSLRFAYPSGPSAQAGLVADIVRGCAGGSDRAAGGLIGAFVVVACKDPLAMHTVLEGALADAGLCVAVQGRIPFAQTDFGRAFLAMARCIHEEPMDRSALTDVLLSPFSGVERREAYRIDKRLRQDRTLDREDALAPLRAEYEPFSQLEELASDPEADILAGVFEQMAQARTDRSAAWRSEQLAAVSALRKVTSAARVAGQDIRACIEELERASVSVSFRSAGREAQGESDAAAPDVLIASQADAAALGSHACSSLIVTDLTTDDYPVADKDDAGATLFGRLGFAPYDSALDQARRNFSALLELPCDQLFLVRPLNDSSAAPAYPCIVLDEFVDAYRADPTATDDIDNPYRLPAQLQEGLILRSEDALFENAGARPVGIRQPAVAADASDESVQGPLRSAVLLPRRASGGGVLARACPSPSAIESYLECPAKWFIDRRLDARELDEGFGPLERGSFAHEVLQVFYQRFQAQVAPKVNAGNIEQARALMAEVLDGLEADQPGREPGTGRLVAATELERHELAGFKRQLMGYLDFEAKLLPTFHPAYFEYEIDVDHAAEYAGYLLIGRVDRIDVDDAGHAVIIDYKGSVGEAYRIAEKTPIDMGKVQTRIYAQAVKRVLGLDVVGALYVTYGRRPSVTGAFDPRVIETVHLPGAKGEHCACAAADAGLPGDGIPDDAVLARYTFAHMLDATEQVVGRAIERMASGDVAPAPATDDACRYCSASNCRKRGEE